MKATEAKLLEFLKKSPQFIIPIYQRTYSWTEKCLQLWEDILRSGRNDAISVHFIGSIVYIERGLSQVTRWAPHLVIDGQQRLTTVTLLLAALARALGDAEPVDGFSSKKLRNYYLLNPEETGERQYQASPLPDRQDIAHGRGGRCRATEGAVCEGDAEPRTVRRADHRVQG